MNRTFILSMLLTVSIITNAVLAFIILQSKTADPIEPKTNIESGANNDTEPVMMQETVDDTGHSEQDGVDQPDKDSELTENIKNAFGFAVYYDYDYENESAKDKGYIITTHKDAGRFQFFDQNKPDDIIRCDISKDVIEESKALVLENDELTEYEPPVDANGVIKYEQIPVIIEISYGAAISSPEHVYITDCGNMGELIGRMEAIRESAAEGQ